MKQILLKTWLILVCLLTGAGTMWGEEVTFDPKSDKTFPKNGITLSVTDGTLTNGTDYRVYKSQTMTISSTAGNITNISLTYSSASYDGGGWAASYQPNSTSWTSPTANGEQARITKIVVTVSGSTPTKYGIAIDPTGLGDTGNGFSVNGTYYSSYQYIENAAAAGETITLIASPKTGYKATADCWNVLQGTTPVSVTGSGNNYSFTMPAGNVSISPVYVAESTPSTPTKLSKPTNLSTANITATSADLSWDAVANASSYMLTVYDDEFNSLVDNQSVSATTYSVSGLTAETHYNWYVTAVGDGVNYSNSDASNDDEFTTLAQGGGDEPGDAEGTGTITFGTNDVKINAASVTGDDDLGNTWTITTVGTTSFTANAAYYQVGASSKPATSITFTTTLPKNVNVTKMSAKFGGFSGTAGTVTLKVGENTIGTGSLNAANDVTVNSTSTASGTVLTVTVTGIAKGVKVYNISYTYTTETPDPTPSDKTLKSISATGTPSEFWKGDAFNHNGITVTALWEDDTETDVTSSCEFTGYDMSTPGQQTVTVTYQEKTCTYNIEVKTIANTQETAYTVAEAKDLIDAGKDLATQVYVQGIVSEIVTAWSDQYKNITYAISDDGQTSGTQFQLFRCVTDGANVGDDIVAYGTLKKFNETYEFEAGNTIVSSIQGTPTKTKPVLSFAKPFVTAYLDALDEFEALTVITNPANLTGVQYSSSDETKATVDANTGVVTINNETTPGFVTITASYAESDDYAAADDASYVINIEANKPVAVKRAIVAEYNGKFYAATTTIENKALVAKEVCVIDGSVVITSEEDVNVISWIVDEENNIYKTEEGKYLSGNKADLSLVDEEASLDVETRALIYRESAGGFKYYATSNASNEGYSALAEVKPILVLTDEEFAARYTYTRDISNALGTICLPYGVDMTKVSNVKFYTVAGKKLDADNKPESVIFTEVEGNLVAGVPYVFKAEENVSKIELPYTGTVVTVPVAGENGLYGAFVKTYLNSIYANGGEDDFYLITNNTIKAATIEGSYIGINRAYLRMTEVPEYGTTPVESSNKMLVVGKDGFSIEDNGTITLIDAIATDKAEGEIYNLQGQRISRLQQGVNIVNGRKVIR